MFQISGRMAVQRDSSNGCVEQNVSAIQASLVVGLDVQSFVAPKTLLVSIQQFEPGSAEQIGTSNNKRVQV